MPPFAYMLSDQEVAEVVTYMRQSWGNRALAVREKTGERPDDPRPPRRLGPRDEPLAKLGTAMVRAVGGDLMGADVLEHEGRLYALEVNGGFGFSPEWADMAGPLVTEFERKVGGWRGP